jgi:hypothetical protein
MLDRTFCKRLIRHLENVVRRYDDDIVVFTRQQCEGLVARVIVERDDARSLLMHLHKQTGDI